MAVMISGRGSNMEALLGYALQPEVPVEPVLVLADRDAPGLATAEKLGVKALAVPRGEGQPKDGHEKAMAGALGGSGAELVCLAGFMRLLSARFCRLFEGRMVNIHPSLLPAYKGLDTHRRILDDVRNGNVAGPGLLHGCSVHYVTPGMDEGPVIAQASVPVAEGETAEGLEGKVLAREHKLYPLVVGALAGGLVELRDGRVRSREGGLAGRIGDWENPLWPPGRNGAGYRLGGGVVA